MKWNELSSLAWTAIACGCLGGCQGTPGPEPPPYRVVLPEEPDPDRPEESRTSPTLLEELVAARAALTAADERESGLRSEAEQLRQQLSTTQSERDSLREHWELAEASREALQQRADVAAKGREELDARLRQALDDLLAERIARVRTERELVMVRLEDLQIGDE